MYMMNSSVIAAFTFDNKCIEEKWKHQLKMPQKATSWPLNKKRLLGNDLVTSILQAVQAMSCARWQYLVFNFKSNEVKTTKIVSLCQQN